MASDQGTYDTPQSQEISLEDVVNILQDLEASQIYVKKLAPNDNSKNQPYFGSHLTDLPFLPTGEIVASTTDSKKPFKEKIKYQASLKFSWIDANGSIYPAPHAKLIYYPQYPEVRFSGFLQGSRVNASKWMSSDKQGRSEGRWLIMGVAKDESIYAYLVTPENNLSSELERSDLIKVSKVIWQLDVKDAAPNKSTRDTLIHKLLEIHDMGWIPGQKLNSDMTSVPYKAMNGGGYTLESMLDIPPNGIAEPDYLGWEVKQFGVTKFPRTGARPTTLMTPEPNGGYYNTAGAIDFVKKYGYPDKNGKENRLNFGGKHIIDQCHRLTKLTMQLVGFDSEKSSITDVEGTIELLDQSGNVTASWSFAKFMNHWKRKHSQAVYIPCIRRAQSDIYEYRYGKDVKLGTGTSFEKILSAMHLGTVFYDPGIKLENAFSETPKLKCRNQFRVNHKHLDSLYEKFEDVDVRSVG